MCKSCGKPASKLLKLCANLSTITMRIVARLMCAMENHQLISKLSRTHSHGYPHAKLLLFPLFEQLLYPVSTTPIITKTNLRKV